MRNESERAKRAGRTVEQVGGPETRNVHLQADGNLRLPPWLDDKPEDYDAFLEATDHMLAEAAGASDHADLADGVFLKAVAPVVWRLFTREADAVREVMDDKSIPPRKMVRCLVAFFQAWLVQDDRRRWRSEWEAAADEYGLGSDAADEALLAEVSR